MTEIHFGAGTVQNHQSRSSDFRWSPPISRHSLLVQPKPVLGARPSLPTIARLCSSVTHTKQPCKLFPSSESNTYRLEVQQYFILWNKEEHPDPVFQYLFIKLAFAFFFFFKPVFISKKGDSFTLLKEKCYGMSGFMGMLFVQDTLHSKAISETRWRTIQKDWIGLNNLKKKSIGN